MVRRAIHRFVSDHAGDLSDHHDGTFHAGDHGIGGTWDLGQEVYIALTKAGKGRGIIAGVGVACIAVAGDRLINQWAQKKRMEFGL